MAKLLGGTTVYGDLSAFGTVFDLSGNSIQWNTAYSVTSSGIVSNLGDIPSLSGDWNSVFSSVESNSANWNTISFLQELSANDQSVYSNVNSNSANWSTAYTSLTSNSENWTTGYNFGTVYSKNSASYATIDFTEGNFLPLSGGIQTGFTAFLSSIQIYGNVTINGNLSSSGSQTFANTVFSTTSALSVINTGVGPALYVQQATGPYDIASFYDSAGIEVVHIGSINPINNTGKVGINESFPNYELTVGGSISATGDFITNGSIVAYNATLANPNITNVNAPIDSVAALNINGTSQQSVFAEIQNLYPGVSASADFSIYNDIGNYLDIGINSSQYNGNIYNPPFNVVKANDTYAYNANNGNLALGTAGSGDVILFAGGTLSGTNTQGGNERIRVLGSGNVGINVSNPAHRLSVLGSITASNIVYDGKGNSNNWNSVYSNVGSLSSNWQSSYLELSSKSLSANFIYGLANESVFTDGSNLIGNGISTLTLNYLSGVYTSSPINYNGYTSDQWNQTYTGVIANSALWTSGGNGVAFQSVSANWNSVYSNVNSSSANWNSVYSNVNSSSANWNTISFLQALSANDQSVYSNVNSNSANWNTGSGFQSQSANNASVYSNVNSNSANWNTGSGFQSQSANNASVYSQVNLTSSNWQSVYSDVNTLSSNWQSSYLQLSSNTLSANYIYGSLYETVFTDGSNLNGHGNDTLTLNYLSGVYTSSPINYNGYTSDQWNQTYTGVIANSALWTSVGNGVAFQSVSANWNSVYSNVNSSSANWQTAYQSVSTTNALNLSSSYWNTAYSLVSGGIVSTISLPQSSIWQSTTNTVSSLSAGWQTAYQSVSTTNALNLSSSYWNTAYSYVNQNSATDNPIYNTSTFAKLSAQAYTLNLSNSSIQPVIGTNTASGNYSVINGGNKNTASGCYSTIGAGLCNTVNACFATVGGGTLNNICCGSGIYSTVGGGLCNNTCGYACSTIGGGTRNTINGGCSVISGGKLNTASGYGATVGGLQNNVGTSYSFIGGGNANNACGICGNGFTSIVGGRYNCTTGSAGYSFIGGGCNNTICSTGTYGVIVGGKLNTASGLYSFIASGSSNNTNGYANTFILGSNLVATQSNFTYVNNLSSQNSIVTTNLSSNYIYGSINETVFTDGSNTIGNGTNTLTMNYLSGVYVNTNLYLSSANLPTKIYMYDPLGSRWQLSITSTGSLSTIKA